MIDGAGAAVRGDNRWLLHDDMISLNLTPASIYTTHPEVASGIPRRRRNLNMSRPKPLKVFVLSKTAGYYHESIPAGISGLKKLAASSGAFTVEESNDAAWLTDDNLAQCDVVLFLQTTGDFLNEEQLAALQRFVRNGGGFVGIHAAAAALSNQPWYTDLIGAGFVNHPEPQPGVVRAEDEQHAEIAGTGRTFEWFDEWYNFTRNPRAGVNVLLSIDEECYRGGKMPDDHPLAWYREFDGGRSFYTSLGHFDEAYEDVRFMKHVLSGIVWTGRGTWPEP
ncbi:carboxylesterase-like protein [Paramyrothecium foliicola]|nr:carboxylesterase-like protein [Paramyrothecium foliicola]